MTMVFNKERGHVDVTKQMFIDFFKTNSFTTDKNNPYNEIIIPIEEAQKILKTKDKHRFSHMESGLEYSGINFILDLIDKNNGIMNSWTSQASLIQNYYDNLYKESQKYVNKPKEFLEGQSVIITPYENRKQTSSQETEHNLMYVPEYVKEKDGKTINLDKEMRDKIMEIAKSGILSILHLKSKEAYVELIKEKIEREILKLTEFHSTGTFAFTFENDEIQLVFVGNHIGIHLKEAA